MVSLRDSFRFEVSSVKQRRPGPRDRGLKDVGRGRPTHEESKRAKRTQFGPGRRRVPEANAQNEPNFARPGTAGGGNHAKRSQTWRDWGTWAKAVLVWGVARPWSRTCETNPISPCCRRSPEAKCAKPSQFGPAAGVWQKELRKTKPNLGGLGCVGKGRSRVGRPSGGSETCKTNPIWGRVVQNEANSPSAGSG
jgi:hypothetical protein